MPAPTPSERRPLADSSLKDALLAEIRASRALFYNTVVAQAQRIESSEDRVTFAFLPNHRALREQFEQTRPWLESVAERLVGRKVAVVAAQAEALPSQSHGQPETPVTDTPAISPKRDLKAEAMSSSAVQAMLDVFPAEIRDVEEM